MAISDENASPPADQPPRGPELFQLLIENVKDYAIFGLDTSGIVVSWNAGAEHIKGYQAEEIIGHHFSRFYPEEAIRSGWPGTELEYAKASGRFEDEGWRVRKDGTKFWANVVITALYDKQGRLRGFGNVTRDLTERMRTERLEADARQMTEFVAMLAHELRNPLAPIVSAVALAERKLDDPERLAWCLAIVKRQMTHLTRLIDDLLDVGRVAKGQIRLERRRVKLDEVIAAAVEAVRPMCDKRQHELSLELLAHPVVRGDEVRLTQVVTNLLSNACKYTPEGGRIDVQLDADDDHARLSVRDTGVGITPDLLPRVFDLFTQAARSLDRSEGGLGIGLAVSKRLVEMHEGTISAHSSGPGCGSEFVVKLPLFKAQGAADMGETSTESGLTVLIVDDNRDHAETMQALLEVGGHRALIADDGPSGLQLAKAAVPDIIFLDIGLPGMNGYQVAREIRRSPELEGVFLAAVTGYGADEDRCRSAEVGFDVHLTKPFDLPALQRAVPGLAL